MTESNGDWIVENGRPVMTRELTCNMNGKNIVIQDHSKGHQHPGGVGDQPPHHNVRPEDNTRTGKVVGMKDHYYFGRRNRK